MRKRLVACRMDGTLMNTEPLKMAAHALTVRDFDAPWISYDRYCALVGLSDEIVCRLIRTSAGISDWYSRAYNTRFCRHYRELAPLAKPVPGAHELLERLRSRPDRIHVVVLSSTDMQTMTLMLRATGIDRLVPRRVSGDIVRGCRALMDPYEGLLHGYGYRGEECVALDSSEPGCLSARAAGMDVIAFRHTLNQRHQLLANNVFSRFDPDEVIEAIERL